jgi:hypothetical protein
MNSTDPEKFAMRIMDAKFGNDVRWQQAKKMASSGNVKEKATNMFKERGVDIEALVNDTLNEINSLK